MKPTRPPGWPEPPLRRLRCTLPGLLATFFLLPQAAQAACQVSSMQMPVKMVGSRAVATVGINGTEVPLTVDSGAFFSTLSDAAAEQLQLRVRSNPGLRVEGITGRVETRMTTVDKLQLLKGEIPRVQFVVGGNEVGAGTMGLMGRNLLSFADTEYDLAHGVIRFLVPDEGCAKSNMAYWAGSAPVTEIELLNESRRDRTPPIRARVKLNGTEFVALFDTGATTVVSLRTAKRAGLAEAELTPDGTMGGLGRARTKAWTAAFKTFELGGEVIRNNRLRVGDFDLGDADMLLGIDFFLAHRIYVSQARERLFITYNGGVVFSLNKSDDSGALPFEAASAASGSAVALSADALARRGAASAARRDYEHALADLNQALLLEPASAPFFAQRGVIEEALRHPAKAVEDFDKALALDPAQHDARLRRAGLRWRAKDRDGTKADLDALDRSLPAQSPMRLPMARLYLDLEQPAPALAQLSQWLAVHPNDSSRHVAFNARCWARLSLGRELDKALDDCNDALDDESSNPSYLSNRGWVQLRLGRNKQALADFERSLELRPGAAGTLYGRGLAKTRLGDAAQGEADLAAARKVEADVEQKLARIGLTAAPGAPR